MGRDRAHSHAKVPLIVLGLIALGPRLAGAQQNLSVEKVEDIEAFDLEELLGMVTTSSGGEAEDRALAHGTVVVIDKDAIARRGLRSVAEALADVPGLYLIDDHVMPSLSVRGVNGGLRAGTRLVKVMINGTPVEFRPDTTAFIGPEYIPMAAVERIEVVLGPLSALYGANAFIATVNVITKQPKKTGAELMLSADQVEAKLGGGVSGFASLANARRGVSIAFLAEQSDRSGLSIAQTFDSQGSDPDRYAALLASRSRQDKQKPFSLFLQMWNGKPYDPAGSLTLQGGLQRLNRGAEFQVNSAMTGQSKVALDNLWSNLRYERRFSDRTELSADVGLSGGKPTEESRLYLFNNDTGYFQPRFGYRALSFGAAVVHKPLGERLSARVAVDGEMDWEDVLYYRQTFSKPLGQRSAGETLDLIGDGDPRTQLVRDLGLSLQVRSKPLPESLPGLGLNANLRVDRMQYGPTPFPYQPSLRLGAVYQWSKRFATKLVGGRAFQTPSPVLMFAKGGYGIGNNVVGNADLEAIDLARPLRPQTVTGAEAAMSMKPTETSHIDVGVFHQVLHDAIQFAPAGTDFVAQNEAAVRSVGMDASAEARHGRFLGGANLAATFLFDGWRLRNEAPALFPRYQGSLELAVDVPEAYVRLDGHLRWVSARGASSSNVLLNNLQPYSLPAYTLVDLTARTTDFPWPTKSSNLHLLFGVRNALGTRYTDPGFGGLDIPSLTRQYSLSLNASF